MWQAIYPDARTEPAIEAPAEFAAKAWTREEAVIEVVRGRLGCTGPICVHELAQTFAVADSDIAIAIATLEREGVAMRGRFTPRTEADSAQGCADGSADLSVDPANVTRLGRGRLPDACGRKPNASVQDEEWCDRSLLARIHRRTLQRLRREIEPVAPRDFMRFLADWQHVAPSARLRGPDAVAAVLDQLEGFETPAAAWESQLLPTRVAGYDIAWLDALCGAGRITWTRLRASAAGTHAAPVRTSPIVLLPRGQLATWHAVVARVDDDPPALSSRAQAVADFLGERGASFFGEITDGTRLLKAELEDALGELAGAGLVGSDTFAGLRALLLPAARRNGARHRRLARHLLGGIADAGRWSLVRRASSPANPPAQAGARTNPAAPDALEHVARVLLRRWGVVFWKLLQREAGWLPPWRELRRTYQRLEARGEIRGGRFVDGIAGEQFALPEAVEALRRVRKRVPDGALVTVSGSDPVNLVGIVLPGDRVPALTGSRIVYRDGVPVATCTAGDITMPGSLPPDVERLVRAALRLSTRSGQVDAGRAQARSYKKAPAAPTRASS